MPERIALGHSEAGMMMQRTLAVTAALAMCMAAGGAAGVERGIYLGGALGQSESGLRTGNVNYTDKDVGYKLIAGFRPLKLLAVEVNYLDLGNARSGGVEAKTKAVDGFVLGFLPLPLVDIYGKLGVISWKTDASAPSLSWSHSGTDLAFGGGVQMHFGALAARLEFEAFDAQEASTPTLLSLGATYTFF